MRHSSRVILVTGTSSGFGRAIAEALHARGDRVFGSSRSQTPPPAPFEQLTLDLTDETSVQAAIETVIERAGHIDAVVNNAGYGLAGAIEETSSAEAFAQIDTNFLGVHRVCRAVLPHFRAQRSGRLITIGSLAGLVSIPFQGFYSASKFALEGYCAALRIEVKPLGIHVSLWPHHELRRERAPAWRHLRREARSRQAAGARQSHDAARRADAGPQVALGVNQ